jgi:hypothetical protein
MTQYVTQVSSDTSLTVTPDYRSVQNAAGVKATVVQAEEVKVEVIEHDNMHDDTTNLTQNQINANIAKRKYIRKKKMLVNLP